MVITAVELLVIILVAAGLMAILTQVFGRGKSSDEHSGTPSVKLVRTARGIDGREETLLMVNERVILTANNDGLRLADYADEVEQLEAVAARIAAALGVTVAFTRVGGQKPGDENSLLMREVPRVTDQEIEIVEARQRLSNADQRRSG